MDALFELSYGALWILVLIQTVILLGLTQSLHEARLQGMGHDEQMRGRKAPRITGVDLTGATFDSLAFAGLEHAYIFVGPNCTSCNVTLDELGGLRERVSGNVAVVCRGELDECALLNSSHSLGVPVLVDSKLQISDAFQIRTVPTAVVVDMRGTIIKYGHPQRDDVVIEIDDALRSGDEVLVAEVHG